MVIGQRLQSLSARTPLRVKLVASLLVLVAIALAGAGLAATTALRHYLVSRVDVQLQAQARGAEGHPDRDGPPPRADDGNPLDGDQDFQPASQFYVARADATGAVVFVDYHPLENDTSRPAIPHLSAPAAAARSGHCYTVDSTGGNGPSWRAVTLALPGGNGSVTVAQSLDEVGRTMTHLTVLEAGIGGVLLLLLGGLGYLVVRRSLRPLVEVEVTAEAIAAGDLSRRVPDRPPRTEVGRLSRALNGMLAQIESSFRAREASEGAARASEDRMRRFVADASHELRTPLTSIRGFAELYRQGAVADAKELSRVMGRIEGEAARMGLLVDDLLLLARLDQQRPLERHPVDVLALATDAVHDAQALAPGRPIRLIMDNGPMAPVVMGDESRLRQVLANLVSNALTHTPDQTPVSVRVGVRSSDGDDWVVIDVIDEGPGLSREAAQRVFERFYRADESRSRSQGGTGLGLSIVAALVAAHGGKVELETEPGTGATFRVLVPAASPTP